MDEGNENSRMLLCTKSW